MLSFNTLFVYGTLLSAVTIAASYKNRELSNCRGSQIPRGVTVQQVTEPFEHSEGPHWHSQSQNLYFVDAYVQKIYRLNPGTGELTSAYIENGVIGHVVTVRDSTDQFVVAAGTDLVLLTWDSEENSSNPCIELLATVETDRNGTRFNDGKVDSHGRLWAGTMGPEHESEIDPDQGSLYLFSSDLIPQRVISPVDISNGCAWNIEDDIFYYIDSLSKQIAAYDFDADTGTISNRRVAFDLPSNNIPGIPDGMTIDSNNNLWIAVYDAGLVINIDPVEGRLLRSIEFTISKVTSVSFGGPSLDILYVTTSRHGLSPAELKAQPKAGAIFSVTGLGVQGLPTNSMALDPFAIRNGSCGEIDS